MDSPSRRSLGAETLHAIGNNQRGEDISNAAHEILSQPSSRVPFEQFPQSAMADRPDFHAINCTAIPNSMQAFTVNV